MRRLRRTCGVHLVALCAVLATPAFAAGEEFNRYALESVSASLSSNQAGAHAGFTTAFELTENVSEARPYALTRDVVVSLPPGLIGNPQRFPRCTLAQFGQKPEESRCPQDAQVGVSEITLAGEINATLIEPVYNMEPPGGDIVARLGLYAGPYASLINVRVDPLDYSLTASIEGAPAAAELISARTTLWGVPAAEGNDALRLTPAEAAARELPAGGRPSGQPEIPFLTNPSDCSTPRQISVTAVSYQVPWAPSTMSGPFPRISGCGKLSFAPTFTATPTTTEAAAPSGLDAVLRMAQDETPNGLGASTLKSAEVTLPAGMTINSAAGDGLAACSAAQVGFGTTSPSTCPEAAKIGTARFEVPALERTLNGAVYQRTPEPGRLFRFWLVTDEQGVHLKLPAEIRLNPVNGQLTTVFAGIPALGGLPQVPVAEIALHIFGGPRAPLATPATCGTYHTAWRFDPWSGKAPSEGAAPMSISSGCAKGGFAPALSAGTTDTSAGAFAPFVMTLTRQDGEANPQSIALRLPEGLLAKLAGVPLCADAQAATGACPQSSKVGRLTAASGVGGAPLWIPQPGKDPTAVYLAGPYKGAPYSIVSVVPAQAGPFDLGLVVNRAAIYIDPETSAARIVTDPLPQILEGVPVSYRTINVLVDRPDFTLNPTSCEAKRIEATVSATNGAVANPTAGFQATNCSKLPYKPRLSLKLRGATKRGKNPQLTAILRPRPGDANSKRISVALPHSEFLDQSHIKTICTRVQFRAGAGNGAECPKGSIYGSVRAWTPLLDKPLAGNVYLRSSSHPLPDLVLALHGQIDFVSVGRIDSHKGGIRNTFEAVPDAPITKVEVRLQGGKKSLLVNSTNICRGKHRANLNYTAHSGRRYKAKAPLRAVKCAKKRRHKGHGRHKPKGSRAAAKRAPAP